MRKRESRVVCLSILIALLVVAPAFAYTPYTSFGKVYEMTNPPGWNSSGDWTAFDAGGGTVNWVDNPTTLRQANATTTSRYTTKIQTSGVGAAAAWTIEVNAAIASQGSYGGSASDSPAGLTLTVMNTNLELTEMVIQTNAIQLRTSGGWQIIDTNPNTSFSAIRLTKDAVGVRVWRIGAEQTLVGGLNAVSADTPGYGGAVSELIQFGDNAGGISAGGSDFEIDYLAFDVGNAYVPEPTTILVMTAGFAACLLSKRRR